MPDSKLTALTENTAPIGADLVYLVDNVAVTPTSKKATLSNLSKGINHANLTNLITGDPHTQYALLAGRSGGQTLIGGTAASNNLTLQSTSHATKGNILFGTSAYDEVNNRLQLGSTTFTGRLGQTFEVTTGATYGGISLTTWSAVSDQAPIIDIQRSKSNSIGSHTALANLDTIGYLTFRGSDGTAFRDSANIECRVDGAVSAGIVPGAYFFQTVPPSGGGLVERLRITSGGQVVINPDGSGASSARLDEHFEIHEKSQYGGMSLTNWDSVTSGKAIVIDFQRSRGGDVGTHAVLSSGDTLGYIVFRGSDGAAFRDAALITGEVDGTPGASDMPGRLVFKTSPDGSASLVERLRISNNGNILVNGFTASTVGLTVKAAASQSANLQEWQSSAAAVLFQFDASGFPKWVSGKEQTTVGAAGAASALPANPTKYLQIKGSDGTTLVIPCYAAV